MSTSHAEPVVTDDEVARLFHEAYERLAPSFGYETRKASAVPWLDVPDNNRRLMTAVVGEVRAALEAAEPIPDEPEIAAIRERADLPDAAVPRVMEDPEADGSLDDLAITGGIDAFHIERMDTGHWWLAVYLNDGTRYSFNLHSKRRIDARYDLEEVGRVRAAATPEADLRGVRTMVVKEVRCRCTADTELAAASGCAVCGHRDHGRDGCGVLLAPPPVEADLRGVGLDVERLARAMRQVIPEDSPDGWFANFAPDVAAEYAKLESQRNV